LLGAHRGWQDWWRQPNRLMLAEVIAVYPATDQVRALGVHRSKEGYAGPKSIGRRVIGC